MKTIIKQSLLPVICLALFSFSHNRGGEGFEVYLNNKLLLQQFGKDLTQVKSIQVDPTMLNARLAVKYHHCGQVGKNRTITIKNEANKVLKEWRFNDSKDVASMMSCELKDIIGLQKDKKPVTLNLFYSSSELPKGRQLAALVIENNTAAKLASH